MKKTIAFAVLVIGLLACAFAFSDLHYRTAIGKQAPALNLSHESRHLNLDDLKGKYVLLNFWNSTNAVSRRDANLYTAWCRNHPDNDMELVCVNFDQNPTLFREIVRRDRLNIGNHFRVAGDTARAVKSTYGLEKGFGSLLIDPQGKIIAHNPTATDLDRLVP